MSNNASVAVSLPSPGKIPLVYLYHYPKRQNLFVLREKFDSKPSEECLQEINKLRNELEIIAESEGSLLSPLVLQASQRLDDLINSYYSYIKKPNK